MIELLRQCASREGFFGCQACVSDFFTITLVAEQWEPEITLVALSV